MKIDHQVQVHAPVERVFEIFSNFRDAAGRIEGIERVEMLTEGAMRVGTRFKETRVIFGRESTEEMEITAFQPNQMYKVEADSCGAHFATVFQFQPNADGTLVRMEMHSRPTSLMARIMAPMAFLMAGSMKKMMVADIHQLKDHCEKGAED